MIIVYNQPESEEGEDDDYCGNIVAGKMSWLEKIGLLEVGKSMIV